MRLIAALLIWLASLPAFAVDATSIWGVPVQQPPAGIFNTLPCPACRSAAGILLRYDPTWEHSPGQFGGLVWTFPHIQHGPSALTVGVELRPGEQRFLDTAPNYSNYGFRGEMAAYADAASMWTINYGQVVINGPSNAIYDLGVWIGSCNDDPGRPTILNACLSYAGGNSVSCPGPAFSNCVLPFSVPYVQCSGIVNNLNVCEVRVTIYSRAASTAYAIASMPSSGPNGGVGPGSMSLFTMTEMRN